MGKEPCLELVSRLFRRDQEISNLLIVDPPVVLGTYGGFLWISIRFLAFLSDIQGLILLVTPGFDGI